MLGFCYDSDEPSVAVTAGNVSFGHVSAVPANTLFQMQRARSVE
jgi:hypothetical protein